MSWTFYGVGTPEHLREALRRHSHHYWKGLPDSEKGAVRHLIGHALDQLDPSGTYLVDGQGHETDHDYRCHLDIREVSSTPLPPPVPEEATES